MKKIIFLVVALCAMGFLLVGCAEGYRNPKSKELVVVNNSDSGIIGVIIEVNVESVNFRGDSPTIIIPSGAEESFYLPPYADSAHLGIYSESKEEECSIYFTYDYKVDGRNETITATYSETIVIVDSIDFYEGNIEVEGSNVTEVK